VLLTEACKQAKATTGAIESDAREAVFGTSQIDAGEAETLAEKCEKQRRRKESGKLTVKTSSGTTITMDVTAGAIGWGLALLQMALLVALGVGVCTRRVSLTFNSPDSTQEQQLEQQQQQLEQQQQPQQQQQHDSRANGYLGLEAPPPRPAVTFESVGRAAGRLAALNRQLGATNIASEFLATQV